MRSCKLSLAEVELLFPINIFILFFLFFFLRTAESDVAIRHKVKVIFQKIQHLQVSRFLLRKNVKGKM